MRALITGITGFVGSHVSQLLLEQNCRVLGTSRGGWRRNTPQLLSAQVPLLKWDIVLPAPTEVRRQIEQFTPDLVFHFAGMSIPSTCGSGVPTPEAIAVNVGGTSNLLDLIRSLPSRPRLIFASTCHVYAGVSGDAPVVTEDSPIEPISAYGETKWMSECRILDEVRARELDACIVRGFQHIGPRQPAGLMLSDWLAQLSDPASTTLNVKCLNSYLDMIDVRDAANAYFLLGRSGQTGKVYNLGSGQVSRSGDTLKTLLAELGRSVQVVEQHNQPQWNAIADITRLVELGWQPTITCAKTIADMRSSPPYG